MHTDSVNIRKIQIARLSVFSNTMLIILKLAAGLISGSVSIISEAIHSFMDLLAAVIAYFSVRVSDRPADKNHPYGHGKVENISGVIEAILIFLAAAWIIYEAVKKLSGNEKIEALGIASFVMFLSAGVNFYVSGKLYKTARETESIALEADALHLKTDVYTSLGVGTGILLIWITGWYAFDPVIAILVAILIIRESFELLRRAFSPLIDTSLDETDLEKIKRILESNRVRFHNLKSRRAGNYRFIELHVEMPPEISLKEVHNRCDLIEASLKTEIANLDVQIHVEPVDVHGQQA